jgi:hypothetical protein
MFAVWPLIIVFFCSNEFQVSLLHLADITEEGVTFQVILLIFLPTLIYFVIHIFQHTSMILFDLFLVQARNLVIFSSRRFEV